MTAYHGAGAMGAIIPHKHVYLARIEQYDHVQNLEPLLVDMEFYVDSEDYQVTGITLHSATATNSYGNEVVLEDFTPDWQDLPEGDRYRIIAEITDARSWEK